MSSRETSSPRSRACSAHTPRTKPENPSQASSTSSERQARLDVVDLGLEQRVDQRVLVREAAVDGPHPHARGGRDVVQRDAEAALGEHLSRGGEDPLPVAFGVDAESLLGDLGRGHIG